MDLGTMLPTYCSTDERVSSQAVQKWASRAEEEGYTGLWVIDHLVEPFTYQTSLLDPLIALAFAAGATETIDLGTSILICPIRETAITAHEAASIQHLAGGDLTLGLGAGYDNKEFEATGVPKSERGPRLSEQVDVLSQLFEGETDYDGRFHSLEDVRIDPVPESPPRLLPGGESKTDDNGERWMPEPMLDRILSADGWICPPSAPEKVATEYDIITEHAERSGRPSESLDTVVLTYTHIVEGDDERAVREAQREVFEQLYSPEVGLEFAESNCLFGTVDQILDTMERYREIGVDELIVGPAARDDEVLEEQFDLLTDRLLPRFR